MNELRYTNECKKMAYSILACANSYTYSKLFKNWKELTSAEKSAHIEIIKLSNTSHVKAGDYFDFSPF